MKINIAQITYFGAQVIVACDRNCGKAWGVAERSKSQLSEDEDDWEFQTDQELGEAPIDPGTYEGSHAKPTSPDNFPNKWCVRQCERCVKKDPKVDHIVLLDFSKPVSNSR